MMFRTKRTSIVAPTLLLAATMIFLYYQGITPFPSSIITFNFHTDLKLTFKTWDSQMGCANFVKKHTNSLSKSNCTGPALQNYRTGVCPERGSKKKHVKVLVKARKWIPDNLDNLYSCRCGISCLWTKSEVLSDKPDALFFENITPPRKMVLVFLRRKWVNCIAPIVVCLLTIFLLTRFLSIQLDSDPITYQTHQSRGRRSQFVQTNDFFEVWDSDVGCESFRERNRGWNKNSTASALQGFDLSGGDCGVVEMLKDVVGMRRRKKDHVRVLVKGWSWVPDSLDNLYQCRCGLTCLWSKSDVLVDKPDVLVYEGSFPPFERQKGEPLRVYIDLESERKPTGFEDIFAGYHAQDDIQITYAGAMFHNSRNYHVSPYKLKDVLVYWSSSRCLSKRNKIAKEFLSLVPHHSFGKCLNNMNGLNVALDLYPECSNGRHYAPQWWDHLHCAMSHYKFVLAIENTITESYVTEKLFYALDSGSVPIYFGAPNVWDFVPPNSIIDASKFSSIEELASYVKKLADDPVAYAEYHAWRRCGVLGNYAKTRSLSIDTFPCRLCDLVSRKGGRNAEA